MVWRLSPWLHGKGRRSLFLPVGGAERICESDFPPEADPDQPERGSLL